MHKEPTNSIKTIIDFLAKQNIKEVERATGIPADRMYKWIKGKGAPKTIDMALILDFMKVDLEHLVPEKELVIPEDGSITREMHDNLTRPLLQSIEFLETTVKYKDKTISVLEERIEELKERIDELKQRLNDSGR